MKKKSIGNPTLSSGISYDRVLAMSPFAIHEFAVRLLDSERQEQMLNWTAPPPGPAYDVEDASAIIALLGPMVMDDFEAWWVGGTNVFRTADSLQQADRDSSVTDMTILVDSPGGYHAAAMLLSDVCLSLTKPVNVVIQRDCFSAAYYVAASCSSIKGAGRWVRAGSIGTLIAFYDITEMLAKFGYKLELTASSELKGTGWPGSSLTDNQRKYLKDQVAEAYAEFTAVVKRGRGLSDAELKSVADGRVFSAAKSLSLKLIDGIDSVLQSTDTDSDEDEENGSGSDPDAPVDKSPVAESSETRHLQPKGEGSSTTATTAAVRRPGGPMDIKTLKSEHPAVAEQLATEAAGNERTRISAILKLRANATHETDNSIIERAIEDPAQNAGSVALALLEAQEQRLNAVKAAREADAKGMPAVGTETTDANAKPSSVDLGKQMAEAFNKRKESA